MWVGILYVHNLFGNGSINQHRIKNKCFIIASLDIIMLCHISNFEEKKKSSFMYFYYITSYYVFNDVLNTCNA